MKKPRKRPRRFTHSLRLICQCPPSWERRVATVATKQPASRPHAHEQVDARARCPAAREWGGHNKEEPHPEKKQSAAVTPAERHKGPSQSQALSCSLRGNMYIKARSWHGFASLCFRNLLGMLRGCPPAMPRRLFFSKSWRLDLLIERVRRRRGGAISSKDLAMLIVPRVVPRSSLVLGA